MDRNSVLYSLCVVRMRTCSCSACTQCLERVCKVRGAVCFLGSKSCLLLAGLYPGGYQLPCSEAWLPGGIWAGLSSRLSKKVDVSGV